MTRELEESVFAIHTAFAQTEHGQSLAGNIRYEKYNLAHLSNEEWVRLLGVDVNNLTHMPLTYGLARSFIRATNEAQPGYLSDEEQELLQVAALIHDQGEAIVGDVSFGDKTEAHEAEEKRQFEDNLDAFTPGASEKIKLKIVKARDEIVFDPNTKLGRIFNAIERCGYMRTALRASQHLQAGSAGASVAGLEWIVADVLSNQPLKLLEYAAEYPAVQSYLQNQADKISTAFISVTPGTFTNYGEGRAIKEAQFQEAYTAWFNWLGQ